MEYIYNIVCIQTFEHLYALCAFVLANAFSNIVRLLVIVLVLIIFYHLEVILVLLNFCNVTY